MLLRKKTFLLLYFLCVCFSIFGLTQTYVYATDNINPQTDINCSKYLNILHNDHFMNKIVVSTLKINPEYSIGTKYANTYIDKKIVALDNLRKDNIGFKCNGIFYSDYVELSTTGTYVFKVYSYAIENNIKRCSNSLLETVSITIDVDDSVSINKENYYFEHYGDSNTLLEDIEHSFNYEVSISTYSRTKIKDIYSNFLKIKNSQTSQVYDISSEVDSKNVQIEVVFQNVKSIYYINILSATNEELKSNFVSNLEELTKDVPKLAFDILINKNLIGNKPKDVLINQLDITPYLNCSEAQNIEIDLNDTNVTIPSLSNLNEAYRTITVSYNIKDHTLNKEYTYLRFIAFYNSNFLNTERYKLKVIYNEKYICNKDETFDLNHYVLDAYYEIVFDGATYYDFYDIKSIQSISGVDTSSLGEKTINILATDSKGMTTTDTSIIKITDNKGPVILTKYDIIIVEKGNTSYIDQIKVIDNNSVDLTSISYELKETNTKGGYIVVSASDLDGITTIISIPFLYNVETSLYQKTLGKWLYEWGNFLKNIF